VRDGILVKELPSFLSIVEPFRSRPGFETRPTRELDLMTPPRPTTEKDKDKDPAATVAAAFPPWATFAVLERAAPGKLLEASVLSALAGNRGVPSALRLEVERDKKLGDGARGALALSRLRVALSYGSRADADAVTTWKDPKAPADKLRVAIAKALLGPQTAPPKLGDPDATKPQGGYALEGLDALAKQQGALGLAAAYDAALLSLDAVYAFGADKKAYEATIARLDAVSALKGLDAARAANAKQLADSTRESLKLLGQPPAKP
jgi:hypothetical protein